MIVESITLKLILDFFLYIEKNGFVATYMKLAAYNGTKMSYFNFSSYSQLLSYYNTNYRFPETCTLGDNMILVAFNADRNLSGNNTNFIVRDICTNTNINTALDYDINRNATRTLLIENSKGRLTTLINQYCVYRNSVKTITSDGIYSSCFAEPGWSKGTQQLKDYTNNLTTKKFIFN